MTGDAFTTQLSPYLDGELDAAAAAALEAHLATCAACRTTLDGLRDIVTAAPHYPGRAPSPDVWRRVEAGLDGHRVVALRAAGRRFGWSQLLAASLLMAAVGGGTGWLLWHRGASGAAPMAGSGASPSRPAAAAGLRTTAAADARYDAAVHDLEEALEAGRGRLDSVTVRRVEESLRRIDDAIAEARAAIQRDPANAYLNRQIAANMRRKLNLLRTAANAIAART
jgi:anti-sigma factor RsiW